MAKNLGGLNSPVNESQGGTNATTFNAARTNMGLNALVNEQTAGYTAVTSDRNKLIHYTGAGGVTLAFDPAATLLDGWSTVVRNDAATAITLDPNGGELIDGAASLTLEPTRAINIYCTGTEFLTQGQSSEIDGANQALSNLASVAINTTLVSDTDVTDNLGTQAIRWNTAYLQNLQTGDTAADVLNIGAWDVDGAAISNFITLTAGNTPTCVLASGVTATTQATNDNSTKIATTAYADAVGSAGGSLTLLSTATASASSVVNFNNLLTSSYDNYLIISENILNATAAVNYTMQVGTGATPTYQTTNYDGSSIQGDSISSLSTQPQGTVSTAFAFSNSSGAGNLKGTANNTAQFVTSVSNVNSASNFKQFCGNGTWLSNTSSKYTVSIHGGAWLGAAVLTSLRFQMSSGNITTGTIKLYGYKN